MKRTTCLLPLLIAIAACGSPPSPPELEPLDPIAVALDLLASSSTEEGRLRLAERRFTVEIDDADWPILHDALESLGGLTDPQPGIAEPLDAGPDPTEFIVDLDVAISELGRGVVSVRLRRDNSSWRIEWFQGPGTEWPLRGRPANEGLSSSAPPD